MAAPPGGVVRLRPEMGAVAPIARAAPLGVQAHAALSEALMTGRYRPGTKLTVRGLAETLGVSTTPARDAINRIVADGALEASGPKTVLVPPLTLTALGEVVALRLALEGLAAELATPNAKPSDIDRLEGLQDEIISGLDVEDYGTVLRANRDFHFTLFDLSGLPRLRTMIQPLWLRIGPSLNDLYPEFRLTRRGVNNHLAALTALRRCDAAKVRAAMEQDIRDGYARLSKHIAEPGGTIAPLR